MTAIWFILAVMTGGTVLALLWPMSLWSRVRRADAGPPPQAGALATETGFYEDQLREIERDLTRGLIAPGEAEAARTEAARRLLRASRAAPDSVSDGIAEPALRQRRAASAFALSTIPLVALIAYGIYGSPHMPSQTAADRQAVQSGGQDMLKAIGQIEARLASDPSDGRGWAVLAPVYVRLGRFDDAAHAYEAATRVLGESPQRLSDWGEALVAGANGTVTPRAKEIFERAASLDASAAKPRFYLARAAELEGDIPGAVRQLTALMESAPADAPWLPLVRETLTRLNGEAPAATARPGAPGPEASQAKPRETKPLEAKPPEAGPAAALQAMPAANRDAAIRGMVEGLDRRLSEKGGTADEWVRLVRSYGVLGDREKMKATLDRARTAIGTDAEAGAKLDDLAREFGLASGPAAPPVTAADAAERAGTDAAVAAVKAMPAPERDAAIRGMVAGLDRRLASKGGTVDDWLRLVRSYSVLGERQQASHALDRGRMALSPDARAMEKLDILAQELGLRGGNDKP
ncbi:c-type cytochrome biogenesis protein CcmI [Methylobacterium sp. E-045]|uniref:c-type cytochrome biogenesis protein CcmI n=1 Tax=Methylobacterium sp. E-045 TaxID=2836575 RepID=UPI001FBB68E7|nr:c-type cytochrome biogenesis protein CcmI [Methylobacterium sp. E-045]MCJ2130549.1 c-type cytochrome biogenesis protein CcmI [Methylobacterium sp. E-045]